jgi:hypothetical protein
MNITTRLPRRSLSVLEVGDTLVFNGLVGEDFLLADADTRTITILNISISGKVGYRIKLPNSSPVLAEIDYLTALKLIEERIWQECELSE